MGLSQELQTGKAGEHLVCCDLIQKGYSAFLADQGLPYDVVIDVEGQLKRVSVKSTTKKAKHHNEAYIFSLRCAKKGSRRVSSSGIDYIAFVFLDKRLVQYLPVGQISSQGGLLTSLICFYETEKGYGGNKRKYIIGRFNTI